MCSPRPLGLPFPTPNLISTLPLEHVVLGLQLNDGTLVVWQMPLFSLHLQQDGGDFIGYVSRAVAGYLGVRPHSSWPSLGWCLSAPTQPIHD
jgi:hypothetical protein